MNKILIASALLSVGVVIGFVVASRLWYDIYRKDRRSFTV